MRIIINCDQENLSAAMHLAEEQLTNGWETRYNKPGWGWFFGGRPLSNARFFIRGIKNGISITQKKG